MGGKNSAPFANIFVLMMEEPVIAPLVGNDILFYRRYVDDVFAVVMKGKEEQIRTKMSSFDPELVFTLEYPKMVF